MTARISYQSVDIVQDHSINQYVLIEPVLLLWAVSGAGQMGKKEVLTGTSFF
jgi:hypothetical protein